MYFAPEMFSKGEEGSIEMCGQKTDLWALGITFYEIKTGRTPFHNA